MRRLLCDEMFILFNLLVLTTHINGVIIEPDSQLKNDLHLNVALTENMLEKRKPVSVNKTLSFSKIKVYDEDIKDTGRTFEDVFSLNVSKFEDESFRSMVLDVTLLDFNVYVIENGVLMLELPNAYNRWTPIAPSNYCVDFRITADPKKIKPRFWATLPREDFGHGAFISLPLLSCFFLLLVLVVYSLLPELRNLAGLILMAHIFSLFMAFLLLSIIQIQYHTTQACIFFTMFIYFFTLATFCWLSVFSFDIWWTFRCYAKAPPMCRRQQYFKFLIYCLFAFGVPFLMTVGLYTLNKIKDSLRHLPWFVTPHVPEFGCYLAAGEEQLYLHIPMLILIICNCIFYLMTASNIWRLSQAQQVTAAAGNTQAQHTLKQRLKVYLKLAVVMGLSWLLELIISLSFNNKIWWLSDINNILVSLAIFLIFVCKKDILKKLCNRYKREKTMRGCPPAKINSSSKSNLNQESTTNQLKVSSQPHGENIHTVVSTNVMDSTI